MTKLTGMGHALPDQQCSAIEHKALREEIERLRDQVESLLHRMTSEEAAQEIERLREEQKTLRWLGEHWPAFWIVMPGWAQAEKYRAAIAALAGKARQPEPEPIPREAEPPKGAQIIDLMEALKKSLAERAGKARP